MEELRVLFLHHSCEPVAVEHLYLIKLHNPGVPIHLLAFKIGLPGTEFYRGVVGAGHPTGYGEEREPSVRWQWWHSDKIVWEWLRRDEFPAKRYAIIEWDMLCTIPFREFYDLVWSKDLAVSGIVRIEEEPSWCWFCQEHWPNINSYGPNVFGIRPQAGILLSRATAMAMANEELKTDRYGHLFVEARIGAMAKACGIEPAIIRPGVEKMIVYHPRLTVTGPGIWHPVK